MGFRWAGLVDEKKVAEAQIMATLQENKEDV